MAPSARFCVKDFGCFLAGRLLKLEIRALEFLISLSKLKNFLEKLIKL